MKTEILRQPIPSLGQKEYIAFIKSENKTYTTTESTK